MACNSRIIVNWVVISVTLIQGRARLIMKRENEEEARAQRGTVNLGFYDLSNMSSSASLLYVGGLMAFFGIIFYILINKLLNKPVDFSKKRR